MSLLQYLESIPSDDHEIVKPGQLIEALGQKWGIAPCSKVFAEKLDALVNFDYRDRFAMPRKGKLPKGPIHYVLLLLETFIICITSST